MVPAKLPVSRLASRVPNTIWPALPLPAASAANAANTKARNKPRTLAEWGAPGEPTGSGMRRLLQLGPGAGTALCGNFLQDLQHGASRVRINHLQGSLPRPFANGDPLGSRRPCALQCIGEAFNICPFRYKPRLR